MPSVTPIQIFDKIYQDFIKTFGKTLKWMQRLDQLRDTGKYPTSLLIYKVNIKCTENLNSKEGERSDKDDVLWTMGELEELSK